MSDEFSNVTVMGGGIAGGSNALQSLLVAEDIQPGDEPSYETAKTIYLYHPLGAKMAEAPITMAQSQEREIAIQDAPDEAKRAFTEEWAALDADQHILNVHALARVYGISSLVLGVKGFPSNKPADMERLFERDVYFQTLDPLNTAGSLVLSQQTNDPNFQRPVTVRTSGETYHPSRFRVVMNERPIFIAYTNTAFGFVGRSVYQRALFPLKSFVLSMVADNLIQGKLGAIVAQMEQPGSVVNKSMQKTNALKRWLIKLMQTGNVLAVGKDETIQTLDMQNVDGAGQYSRTNILKNIATAGDMPARLLENETMVSGFGEGTEDAKAIAQYINRIRIRMRPEYRWFENICQYRAWNEPWYKRVIQPKYPQYQGVDFKVAFSQWRQDFHAEWPSLLEEPESEEIKVEAVKLEAVVAFINSYLPQLDPEGKAKLLQWGADIINENKRLFPHELVLDWEAIASHQVDTATQETEDRKFEMEGKGFRLDAGHPYSFDSLRDKVSQLGIRPRQARTPVDRLTA